MAKGKKLEENELFVKRTFSQKSNTKIFTKYYFSTTWEVIKNKLVFNWRHFSDEKSKLSDFNNEENELERKKKELYDVTTFSHNDRKWNPSS